MHEYPLTCNIIDIAAKHVAVPNQRVSKITLVIGQSSGILGESIALYFDLIAAGTVCEGAVLDMEYVTPMLKCKVCGQLFERKPFSFQCTANGCTGEGEPTDIGREFYIKHIETRDS